MHRHLLPAVLTLPLLLPPTTRAADPPPPVKKSQPLNLLPILAGNPPDQLAGSLRGHLARNLPPTLFEASPGWGNMKLVTRGVEWKGKGLHVHAERQRSHKNDGVWRKYRAEAVNLPDTLVLDLRDVQQPEPGRLTFDVFLSFDARLHYEQQNWEAGTRLYSGGARARLRVRLLLKCELTARTEANGTFLPDAIIRLRVVKADLNYDNFVTEHIAGVGGEAAKILGDAVRGGLHKWHPSLERELLARADAAIVKAADTKEVRLSIAKVLNRTGK